LLSFDPLPKENMGSSKSPAVPISPSVDLLTGPTFEKEPEKEKPVPGADHASKLFNHLETKPSSTASPSPVLPNKESSKWKITVLDQNGTQFQSLNVSEVDKERELAIQIYYQSQQKQLTSQISELNKKCVSLYYGYISLSDNLNSKELEKENLQKTLLMTKEKLGTAIEDLELTRKNYEQQLSVFSEHISVQTETLGKQEDELEMLKNHRVYCGKCKLWNSVTWLLTEGQMGKKCSGGNHGSGYNYSY